MRKLIAALTALAVAVTCVFLPAEVLAQTGAPKTQAQMSTEIGVTGCSQPTCLYPDNTTGLITPFGLRQGLLDLLSTLFGGGLHSRIGTFNIMAPDYGAKCDGLTDDSTAILNAVNAAIAAHGTVYTPPGVVCIINTTISLNNVNDFTIESDSSGSAAGPNAPSWTTGNLNGVLKINGTSSGSSSHIKINNMRFGCPANSSVACVQILNVLYFTLDNTTVQSYGSPTGTGAGLSIQSSGNGLVRNVDAYGFPALTLGDTGGAGTTVGPIAFQGGQYTSAGGTTSAVVINGAHLLKFDSVDFEANGTNSVPGSPAAVVTIDGPSSNDASSVDFVSCHLESDYNFNSTSVDFLIGATHAAGHVGFFGNTMYGGGDGTHVQNYSVQVVAASDIRMDGNLAWKGYTTAVVYFQNAPTNYTMNNLTTVSVVTANRYNNVGGFSTSNLNALWSSGSVAVPATAVPFMLNSWNMMSTQMALFFGVNFNSVGDTSVNIANMLPSGYNRIKIRRVVVYGASHALSAASVGLFGQSGGGVPTICAAAALTSITATGDNVTAVSQDLSCDTTMVLNPSTLTVANTLYVRVTVAEGAAATGSVAVYFDSMF